MAKLIFVYVEFICHTQPHVVASQTYFVIDDLQQYLTKKIAGVLVIHLHAILRVMITVDRNHNNVGKESRLTFAQVFTKSACPLCHIKKKNLNFLNSVTETVPICGMTDGRTDGQTDTTKPMVCLQATLRVPKEASAGR